MSDATVHYHLDGVEQFIQLGSIVILRDVTPTPHTQIKKERYMNTPPLLLSNTQFTVDNAVNSYYIFINR
jgi:hypothetical protein